MLLVLPEKKKGQCEHQQLVQAMPKKNLQREDTSLFPCQPPRMSGHWCLGERFYGADLLPGQELQAGHKAAMGSANPTCYLNVL